MKTIQKEIKIEAKSRGFHLITNEIVDQIEEINKFDAGILILSLKHTSASICLNECASPDVRTDLENFFNKLIPENSSYFEHIDEGIDDMPAHIKSVLVGTSITIPITNGKLNLGTWQGIYFGEHRNLGGTRRINVTIMG